jgi:predicted nucleotidyltransferase
MRRSETGKTSRIKGKRSAPKKGATAPKKGAVDNGVKLATSLFGKTRKAILALFYSNPDESFYLRQVVRFSGLGMGVVNRELLSLAEAGILNREAKGQEIYYTANKDCPIFEELRGLVVKTFGVGDVLRAALAPLAERIKAAFIYGSFAKGTENHKSDIDVMVIGNAKFSEVAVALHDAQEKLRREVSPTVYSVNEFKEKIAVKHHFLTSVLKAEKIFLIGSEHELGRLA